jgi:ketosteroid isomerase-like protein
MTGDAHEAVMRGWARVVREHDWDAIGEYMHGDAVLEYPQPGERFVGIQKIRAQFENYPGLSPGTTELQEVIGGTKYALTPNYTVIAVEGSGDTGAAVMRVRYPDDSQWWAIVLYELREDKIARSRTFFAQDFDPPEWRAPYREAD